MRLRPLIVFALLLCLCGATPAAAKIVLIESTGRPKDILTNAESARIAKLQSASFPSLLSDVSPDDRHVLISAAPNGQRQTLFLNIQDGSTQPVLARGASYPAYSNVAWRDPNTAVFISADRESGPLLVELHSSSGKITTRTLDLPGFPISLAPNATRVLVAIEQAVRGQTLDRLPHSPFNVPVRSQSFRQTGPEQYDSEGNAPSMSTVQVQIASFDLNSQELVELEDLPANSILASEPQWSADGSKVTFVRTSLANRGQGLILSDLETQDALGNLPAKDNPFFRGNVVDAFDIHAMGLRPALLKAEGGNGDLFVDASWGTDGATLMTKLAHPAQLSGRKYPTYLYPDRSYLSFYDAAGRSLQQVLDRPEINAPNVSMPLFVSPDEVIINAPVGVTWRLFYFNRRSGEFRQISQEDGTYYQVRATHLSRQLVFNQSSFQHPYELYRLGWDGKALYGLTFFNAGLVAENKIRGDYLTVQLKNGATRVGYLLQPANAPFPPKNANLIVWQEGGPGFTISNGWNAAVERPFNLLPNFGFAVLLMAFPGREGFGPQFFDDLANDHNFGQIDIDEAAEVVQQFESRGWTSPGHVGITGCSYGGYFTAQSIVRHPTLYAAANPQCTLLDTLREFQFGQTAFVSYLEGVSPTANAAEWTKDSPIYHASEVRTPTLLFDGTSDYLPPEISANFHDQLTADKVPADFLLFRGEGHGLQSARNEAYAAQAQINWFRTYLGSSPQR